MNNDDEVRRLLSEILETNRKQLKIAEESALRQTRAVRMQAISWRAWIVVVVIGFSAIAYFIYWLFVPGVWPDIRG